MRTSYLGLEGPEDARRLERLGYGRFDRTTGKPRFFIPRTTEGVKKFLADYPAKAETVQFSTDLGDTHDIVKDGKTVFTGRFRTDAQADGYARHFYGEGAKAVRRETADFDTNLSATLEPEAWGDLDRKVKVVGNGVAPWKYVKGKSMKEAKEEIAALAIKNIKSQENYTETGSRNALSLKIGDVLFRIPVRNLFHGSARNINAYGQAASIIGDVMNAAVEIPNVESPWHYYIASANFGRPCYVLVTATEGLDGAKNVISMQTLYSVNTKTSGAARELNHTNASRLDEDSVSNLRDAWQSLFLPGLERHNAGKSGKLEKSDEGDRPKIDTRITPAEDAAYMDAVKRGDMKTAARMVREAAAKAWPNTKVVGEDGLPLVVWHGLENENSDGYISGREYRFRPKFHIFDTSNGIERGAFFSSEKGRAEPYGNVAPFFINVKNPLFTEASIERKPKGHDGAYRENVGLGKEWVVFSPSQIKSADPVTYDDAGNVIPLSQRFNDDSQDVRYKTLPGANKYTGLSDPSAGFAAEESLEATGSAEERGVRARFAPFSTVRLAT